MQCQYHIAELIRYSAKHHITELLGYKIFASRSPTHHHMPATTIQIPEHHTILSHTAIDSGKIRDPVRSPIDKPLIARLVVGWVTTSESLVLYVFVSFFLFPFSLLFSFFFTLFIIHPYLS